MATATSRPPAPKASIPRPPPVGVGANEGFAGLSEPLQMHLMTDAVAGAGEVDAVFGGYGLEIPMVVGIFKAALQRVVVYISDAEFCFGIPMVSNSR